MPNSGQIPLRFPEQFLSFEEMVVTASNRGVIAAVRRVDHWPYHVFCLVGPPQSGLTTIAREWAKERSGIYLKAVECAKLTLQDIETMASGNLVVDGADDMHAQANLLNLVGASERSGGRLLLASHQAPSQWQTPSPDLASRLKSAPIGDLGAPDEDLMRGRIKRACARAYLNLPQAVEDYLVIRLGLNFEAIEDAVLRLDGAVTGKAISVPLAREVLQDNTEE